MTLLQRDAVFVAVISALQDNLAKTEAAAQFARETATAKENAAENKYDTLGLEAAYLAESQSARVAELKGDLSALEKLSRMKSTDRCAVGSLETLADASGNRRSILLSPCQGGLNVTVNGQLVQLVTLSAPVGKALLGAQCGDDVVLFGQEQVLELVALV